MRADMRFEGLEKRADVRRLDGLGQLDGWTLEPGSEAETAWLGEHAIEQIPGGRGIAYKLLRQTDLKRSVETKQESARPRLSSPRSRSRSLSISTLSCAPF